MSENEGSASIPDHTILPQNQKTYQAEVFAMNIIDTTRVPELLTVKETAKRLGLSEYAVRQLVHNGSAVTIRPGGDHGPYYINLDKLVAYLNGGGDNG